MVRCSFTRKNIEPGTGKMYVKKDGTILWFINSKAEKNFLELHREARFLKWTGAYKKGAVPKGKQEQGAAKASEAPVAKGEAK